MTTLAWLHVVSIVGLYALLIAWRIRQERRDAAWRARRAQMFCELRAAGYYDVKPPPPLPARKRWFDADGVEIFED